MKSVLDKISVFVASVENFKGNRKLPDFAAEEIEKVTSQKVLDEKFAAFGLLDWALKHLGLDDDFDHLVKINGKPHSPAFQFSYSHSHSLVAVAICKKDVGIDIEMVDEKHKEKLKKIVGVQGGNAKELTKIWTKKEAAFKVHGGKRFAPNEDCFCWCKTKKIKFGGKTFFLSVCGDEKRRVTIKRLF